MIRKTGKEIHRLRKAKLGQNELDKHMFQEKLTFLTASKVEVVPPLNLETESSLICNSRSSTLKHVDNHGGGPSQASMIQSMVLVSGSNCDIDSSPSSSTCSTPTPHLNKKTSSENTEDANRFSYEIDPDIGVIVWIMCHYHFHRATNHVISVISFQSNNETEIVILTSTGCPI